MENQYFYTFCEPFQQFKMISRVVEKLLIYYHYNNEES